MRIVLLLVLAFLPLTSCSCDTPAPLSVLRADIVVDRDELSFGSIYLGARPTLALRFSNAGNGPATQISATITDPQFSLDGTLPNVLPAGESLVVNVAFAPALATEVRGTLTLSSDAASGGTVVVVLDGIGLDVPLCAPSRPCLDIAFDPDLGLCVEAQLEGSCNDDNACTIGGVCVAGACLGEARACEPPTVACMLGLCDTTLGCTNVPVHENCDDGDPCTEDLCTENGCSNLPANDGTPCGTFDCTTSAICISGACQEFQTPDGTPCNDGDSCSTDDACNAGTCTGVAVVGGAAVVGEALTFGSQGAVATLLGDGRIVVLDIGDTAKGGAWTVLQRSAGGVVSVESQTVDLDITVLSNTFAPLSTSSLALLDPEGMLTTFSVDDTGVQRRGVLALDTSTPGYLRSPMVAIDAEHLATCHDEPDVLRITRAWPPEEAGIVRDLDLEFPCVELDWEAKSERLLVRLASGEILRLDPFALTPNLVPVLSDQLGITSNGDLVATAVPDGVLIAFAREIVLRDATSLDEISRFEPPLGVGFSANIVDLALTERWLFVVSASFLSVYDISDPAAPTLVTSSSETAPHNTMPFVLATDGTTMIRSSSLAFWDVFHLFDLSGAEPVELRHPRRGGMRRLVRSGNSVFSLHTQATHLVDLESISGPQIVAGGWQPNRSNILISVGQGVSGQRFLVGLGRKPIFNGLSSAPWRDDTNPAASLMLGNIDQPFLPGALHFESDGRFAFALRMSNDDEAFFDSYDLSLLEANTGEAATANLASLALNLPGSDRNAYGMVTIDENRTVVITQHDWGFETPDDGFQSEVLLIDIADPTSPQVLANLSLSGLVRQGRSIGGKVLLVRRTSGGWFNTEFEGEEVLLFSITGDALILDASLPLDRSAEVLWMNQERAAIRTETGLAFLTYGSASLVLEDELALWNNPTDVFSTPDTLWVVGEQGLTSVRPPCP